MRGRLLRGLFAIILTLVGVAVWKEQPTVVASTGAGSVHHKDLKQARASINLYLPRRAEVVRGNRTLRGRVTRFDAQGKTLRLELAGRSIDVPLGEVAKVTFIDPEGGAEGSGSPPIRTNEDTWRGIPLDAFEIRDPASGQAIIRLPSGVQAPVWRAAMVQEITFSFSGASESMTLRVIEMR